MNKIKMISASAGSGKTYTLKEELANYIDPNGEFKLRPEGVIATTFTKKAAAELRERVRAGLVEKGFKEEGIKLEGALISTVHSVCTKLIEKFSYELGLSPSLEIIPEEDQEIIFNQSLANVLEEELVSKLNTIGWRLTTEYVFDWRSVIKSAVSEARGNNISIETIRESSTKSWDGIKKFLPDAGDKNTIESNLIQEIDSAILQFEALPKLGQNDKKFLKSMKDFKTQLQRKWSIKWDAWLALSNPKLNKPGEGIAGAVTTAASQFMAHPDFHSDYKTFLELVFELSANALNGYQEYKKERGLVDFADMESIVLEMLDNDVVKSRISDEFDLLMVDEFQDTNPIQLSIFLKLSDLIPNAVFVGDPKQSIYGFRGADPELMNALLEKLSSKLDYSTLGNSYRTLPSLVNASNDLFTKVFEGKLEKEKVCLEPTRPEQSDIKKNYEVWRITKSQTRHNKERDMRGIAREVAAFIESGYQVVDKDKDKNEFLRQVRPKDVAILCRSNDNCAEISGYLEEEGLKVATQQDGLLARPESALLLSSIRYLCFKSDSLAPVEIQLLVEGKDNIEELIDKRLEFVENDKAEEFGKDHWFISRLDKLREISVDFSPLEVVNHILTGFNLQRIVLHMGDGQKRWENLLEFRNLATKYEESCHKLKIGSSIGGFLLWISELDEKGLLFQSNVTNEFAVNVLTWHRSKGLEWPVVVLNDCSWGAHVNPFGVKICSDESDIDIKDPLKGRYLRYWLNPFHPQRNNYAFKNNVEASEEYEVIKESGITEAGRLLYVGFTRARDYLFIPLRKGEEAAIFTETMGSDSFDLPDDTGEQTLPWSDDDGTKVNVRDVIDATEPYFAVPEAKKIAVPKELEGIKDYLPYKISPSSMDSIENASARLLEDYSGRINISGKVEDSQLGDCIHDIMALNGVFEDDIKRVLENYELQDSLSVSAIKQQKELYKACLSKLGLQEAGTENTILAKLSGQKVSGVIDELATDGENYILIDHKTYQGTDLEKKAVSFSGQLKVYRDSLELTGKKVSKVMINFISQGKLYEVKLE